MQTMISNGFLAEVAEKLELPESAYEKAEDRYNDLGGWISREESTLKDNSPHIFPQGSFRLGTANRPLNLKEEYDLDLACNLREGITKITHTQSELKNLIGKEIEQYRNARGIKEEISEKKRCWRLEYADHIKFHLDIVPCIPENEERRRIIKSAILRESNNEILADAVSEFTVAITDNTRSDYQVISEEWNISNPEGYAKWFESRMKLAKKLLEERARLFKSASIDKIPSYKWKTPLQMSIQLLKRHRDIMFKVDPDIKPISIIVTTLAARAYQGESEVENAVLNILDRMENLVNSGTPRVPNPVNPSEDFTDKWGTREGLELGLEDNFWDWLTQARKDFEKMCTSRNAEHLTEQSLQKFAIRMDKAELAKKLGIELNTVNIITPKHHEITEKPKPWQSK